jgi:hypothetical protein
MGKTTITLVNSIHGTSCKVRVFEDQDTLLEKQTVYRIRKTLCPDNSCGKCGSYLNEVGESNPLIEEKDDGIYVLTKKTKGEDIKDKDISDSGGRVKKVKISDSDRKDKESDSNWVHFTVLESKIMVSALEDGEKTRLFDFIRDMRNEAREEEGLGPICLVKE